MPPPNILHDPVASLLVVDDVEATRIGLIELLHLRGYEAHGARNGAEGLQRLRENPSMCVVVLDLAMPETNGYWFRAQQLNDPALTDVPVIVFTGAGQVVREALGGCEVLTKPFAVDHLMEAVERCCQKLTMRSGGGTID